MSTAIASPPAPGVAALHLTQIQVPYDDAIRLLRIRDTYDWHQRIWQAFGSRDGESRDFLVRIDRKEDAYRVLVLSTSVPERPAWCPIGCFGTKAIPEAFFEHPRYSFSLLANPTRKIRVERPDGTRTKNGRRVPVTQREDLVAWILRKADAGGFAVQGDAVRVIPRGREFFHKDGIAHGSHSAVEFQGELRVLDPVRFRSTVSAGIGSAKAFGFGLLVLAPLASPTTPS